MRSVPAAVLALALVFSLAPTATAATMHWVVIVENGPCLGGAPYCFEIEEGTRDPVEGGTEATITVRNTSNTTHEYFALPKENIDRGRIDTKPAGNLGHVRVPPGSEDSMTFTIPTQTAAIYLWCDEPGHEEDMDWLLFEVKPKENEESPALATPLVLAALAALAVLRRRS